VARPALPWLLVPLALCALSLPGDARPDDEERLRTKLSELEAEISGWFSEDARWAERVDLHAEATLDYRLSMAYDADNRLARRGLGWYRRGNQWNWDPSRSIPGDTLEEHREDHGEEYEARRRERFLRIAAEFEQLVGWAMERDMERGARWICAHMVTLLPDHPDARRALGYVRSPQETWIFRGDVARIRDASGGRALEGRGPLAERTRLRLAGRESEWLRVEGQASTQEVAAAVAHGEAAHALFVEMFQPEPEQLGQVHVGLFSDKEGLRTFVDATNPEETEEERERLVRQYACLHSHVDDYYAIVDWGDHGHRLDGVIWYMIRQRLRGFNPAAPRYPWLLQGLSAVFTLRLAGSAHYYIIGQGTLNRSLARLSDPRFWPLRVRALVATAEAPLLPLLVRSTDFNSFSADDLALAWSLCTYLLREHPSAMRLFLRELDAEGDAVDLLCRATRRTPEELEEGWHAWIRAAF
jgi:hypothetical protein